MTRRRPQLASVREQHADPIARWIGVADRILLHLAEEDDPRLLALALAITRWLQSLPGQPRSEVASVAPTKRSQMVNESTQIDCPSCAGPKALEIRIQSGSPLGFLCTAGCSPERVRGAFVAIKEALERECTKVRRGGRRRVSK